MVLSGAEFVGLGFNSGVGVMRVGCRANTALGRFVRLWMRNVAGLRTPPGVTDACAIGQTFFVAMVEDETATTELGWQPLRERWGFDSKDEALAVQGIVGASLPMYTSGGSADEHLDGLARRIAATSAHFASVGVLTGSWWPTLAINPAVAEVFARHGMQPIDVAEAIAVRALAPAEVWKRACWVCTCVHWTCRLWSRSARLPLSSTCRTTPIAWCR